MKNYLTGALTMVAGFGLGATTVQVIQAQPTPPEPDTIAEVEVTDPETYKQYIAVGVPPADGHFIARGGRTLIPVLTEHRQSGSPLSSGLA